MTNNRVDEKQVLRLILYDNRDELERLDLTRLDLSNGEMWGACLNDLDLQGTRFANANLFGATLERSNLRGCDFVGANLSRTNFVGAVYDENTRFPSDFDSAARGMIAYAETQLAEPDE